MQLAGKHLLARTGFALHQHWQVTVLDSQGQAQMLLHARIDQRDHRRTRRFASRGIDAYVQDPRLPQPWQLLGGIVGHGAQGVQVEYITDMLRHLAKAPAQSLARLAVQGMQAAVLVPGQQQVGLAVHVSRCAVGLQHPVLAGAVHEKSVFDGLGALGYHLAHQVLAAAVIRGFECRGIHYPQQIALRVEDRRGGAGKADEGCAEVVALVHRHR